MRITKAMREAEARFRAAFDAGAEYHRAHLEDDLATVHRYASAAYPVKDEALEFVYGYSTARQRRDEYLKEKTELPHRRPAGAE